VALGLVSAGAGTFDCFGLLRPLPLLVLEEEEEEEEEEVVKHSSD
jgi:hypothetical protein